MAAVAPSCSLCASTVPSTIAGSLPRLRSNARLNTRQPSTILPAISSVSSFRLSVAPSTRGIPAPASQHRHSRQSTHSRAAVISAAAASDTPEAASPASSPSNAPVERVLVVGASGGVGQLCVASLVAKNRSVRALVRSVEKAESLFADAPADLIQVVTADLRKPGTISPALFAGISAAIVCVGTTAFPSKRWDGDNGPEQTDYVGVKNLLAALPRDSPASSLSHQPASSVTTSCPTPFIQFLPFLLFPSPQPPQPPPRPPDYIGVKNLLAALPKDLSRIVFVSSAGVERYNQLPYSILNLFGVLKYKKMAEDLVKSSGIPYTILRPGRLTDGPYTSYDLNTLLKATAGMRKAVEVKRGSDTLSGETSRVVLAEGCVQALGVKAAENEVFEMLSVEGEGPGGDESAWEKIFASAPAGKRLKTQRRVVLAEGCVQVLGVQAAENEVFEMKSLEGEGPGGDEGAWEKILHRLLLTQPMWGG
ncbi:unnamed protein product [Closterium sp. NIES-65]|nr:unnamed protein product [Closterium sp. NIES-65]